MIDKHYLDNMIFNLENRKDLKRVEFTKDAVREVLEYLKAFRDQAEQIRSLEEQLKNAIVLPVKIGDKIYCVPSKVNYEINKINKKEERNKICEFVVSEIRYTKYGYSVVCYVDYIPFYFNYEIAKTHCEDFEIEQFYGETWFATREEAEKRLSELKGDNK